MPCWFREQFACLPVETLDVLIAGEATAVCSIRMLECVVFWVESVTFYDHHTATLLPSSQLIGQQLLNCADSKDYY
jgi:hypothetical protein